MDVIEMRTGNGWKHTYTVILIVHLYLLDNMGVLSSDISFPNSTVECGIISLLQLAYTENLK